MKKRAKNNREIEIVIGKKGIITEKQAKLEFKDKNKPLESPQA